MTASTDLLARSRDITATEPAATPAEYAALLARIATRPTGRIYAADLMRRERVVALMMLVSGILTLDEADQSYGVAR